MHQNITQGASLPLIRTVYSFFLFLSLGALTTIIAVFECIIGGIVDELRMRRAWATLGTGIVVALGALPTVFVPGVMEKEDFVFSQLWLPLGALAACVFVSRGIGWGFDAFRAEASEGEGAKLPHWAKTLYAWIIPAMIVVVLIGGMM